MSGPPLWVVTRDSSSVFLFGAGAVLVGMSHLTGTDNVRQLLADEGLEARGLS